MAKQNRTTRSTLINLIAILMVASLFLYATQDAAMMQAKPPYDKEVLLKVVRLNALLTEEIVGKIQQRGVNFQTTADVEAEFRAAGAKPELIEALRNNYRPGSTPPGPKTGGPAPGPRNDVPAGPPLSKNEIITMLQSKVPVSRVERFVEVRGVNFAITPEIAREVMAAGGNRTLIGVITEKGATAPANMPDYDDLTDKAQTELDFNNHLEAVRLLQQAIKMDSTKPTAYQLLGYAQLYGSRDIASAEKSMRQAIERKGAAVFRAYHDHGTGGLFTSFCTGKLQVLASRVHFKADQDGKDSFETEDAKIKEAKLNKGLLGRIALGRKTNAFHIEVTQPNGKTRNYNFAPATGQEAESKLILALLEAYK